MLRSLTTNGQRPNTPEQIGDRMRKARLATGASQTDIGDALEISRQTVIDWEKNHRRPSKIAVFAWAHVTGCDFEWLWTDEPTANPELPLWRKGARRLNGALGPFTPMVA